MFLNDIVTQNCSYWYDFLQLAGAVTGFPCLPKCRLFIHLYIIRNVRCVFCACSPVFRLRGFWGLTIYLSKPPCRNKKRQRKKSTIFTFSLPLCSCLGRCVPPLFVYFGKEGPLSTCLLWVNEHRPDSCQLCPSTGSLQPGRCRPASTLCTPWPHCTWSNTVKEKAGSGQLSSN